jgi:hypothetical protein
MAKSYETVQQPLRFDRADSGQEAEDPDSGNQVTRVLRKTEKGENVFDVGGF